MNRESLNILLKKAYCQQLSEEERETLKLWLGESGENAEMYKRLMSGQSLTEYSDWVTGFDLSRAMEAIRSKVKRNRQRRIRKSVSWVAACVILCLGITFVFYFTSMDSEQVLTEQMAAQIQPGSAKAILTLGDGRQVALDKKPIELLVNKQQMVTGDSATLNYSIVLPASETEQIQRQEVAEYHTIEVPAGGEYHLVLADGTKIWLNAESSLVFPVEFSGNKRQVILKGEAYFEVTKNRHKPFTVQSDAIRVRVLGTTFNLKSDKRCRIAEATLIEGEIEVKGNKEEGQIILTPGQRAELNKNNGRLTVKQVDAKLDAVWHDNLIPFQKADIFTITKALERFYDVKIILSPDIQTGKTYSGVLKRKSNIESVLKSLQNSIPIDYKIVGNNIFISPK